MAAETERVADGDVDYFLDRFVGDVIQIAIGIRRFVIDRRGHFIGIDSHRRNDRFNRSGGSKQMSRHRFRGTDVKLVRVLAKSRFDRL